MAKEDIDRWAKERLKQLDGTWIIDESPIGGPDVMFCILYAMENRSPDYYDTKKFDEYVRLVELGCQYVHDERAFEAGRELWARLQSDDRDLNRHRPITFLQKWREPKISKLFKDCARKAYATIFEEEIL